MQKDTPKTLNTHANTNGLYAGMQCFIYCCINDEPENLESIDKKPVVEMKILYCRKSHKLNIFNEKDKRSQYIKLSLRSVIEQKIHQLVNIQNLLNVSQL
ncbi:Hypothetical_protein [Hexamita inflata]|uniref:Hypothetical_protein n=1 Tax=Hexamita inflata TaxID=28002 RepID=A0AA86RBE4_9EUKA|nr:Hypothetical protein HINF_LOCUS5446 [Hexamita inflata]CAI9917806.1 Hypothetical protein HINF_LOCUS5451 [Hexamita inflata]CAI9969738.1 Hypothetical protein HINF_LOCUS57383 [Hexamita inflata]CAI9969743.1 Hypothetical protein HINF_LOCUS57388 [Hexamita inflata]